MIKVLDFIMTNYTWILFNTIIVLLAIVGSYAEKTNFGQGKKAEDETEDKDESKKDVANANIDSQAKIQNLLGVKEEPLDKKVNKDNSTTDEQQKNDVVEQNEQSMSNLDKFENQFEKLDKEVEAFLPKKDIINDDLLNEIDSLSFDKTQKLNLNDIPDLDDVELPKIKDLKSTDEDIWKF